MRFLLSDDVAQEVADSISDTVSDNIHFFSRDEVVSYFAGLTPTVLDFLMKLIIAIVILLVGRKIIKVIRKFVNKFLDKLDWDKGVKQFFDHLLNVALYFLLIMIVLSRFGITTSTVIAVIGSVGLSVGLALQGSLSNFAGGVLILLLHPFRVGDYIREDTKGNEGFVKEIQLFYTKLQTYDNQIIILPNGTLSNCSLINYTEQEKRRLDVKVGISYDADIREAKNVMLEVIKREEKALADEEQTVFVSSLGDSAVDLVARMWVRTEDYLSVQSRVTENIKYALDEHQIEIPYPHVTVTCAK